MKLGARNVDVSLGHHFSRFFDSSVTLESNRKNKQDDGDSYNLKRKCNSNLSLSHSVVLTHKITLFSRVNLTPQKYQVNMGCDFS